MKQQIKMSDNNSVKESLDQLGTKLARDIVFTTVSKFYKLLQENNVASDNVLKELSSTFLAYQATHGMKIKSAVTVSRTKKTVPHMNNFNVTSQLLAASKSRGYSSFK